MGVVSNKIDITDLQLSGGGGGDPTIPGRVTALEAETVQLAEGLALVQTSVRSLDLESVQLAEGLALVQTSVNSGAVPMQTGNKIKFGVDGDGNYGYYKAGADTVTPFLTGGGGGVSLETIESYLNTTESDVAFYLLNKPKYFIVYPKSSSTTTADKRNSCIILGHFENSDTAIIDYCAGYYFSSPSAGFSISDTYTTITSVQWNPATNDLTVHITDTTSYRFRVTTKYIVNSYY